MKTLHNITLHPTVYNKLPYVALDFAKVERALLMSFSSELAASWEASNITSAFFEPKPNLRRAKEQSMTREEVKIQIALGTLPYKEWMKLKDIMFYNKWWYFPMPKDLSNPCKRIVTINDTRYYPVADGYIDDLHYSMSWRKWTEEEFAKEIIAQCYSCMGLETIDH